MAALAQQQISKTLKKPWVVCLLATLSCALWGSAFPVIKIGYKLWNIDSGDSASQILFAGVRFILAGVLTVVFGSIISKKLLVPKKDGVKGILLLALFQTVLQYLFFYMGLARTSGAKASILDSVSVFFSVLIATLVLKNEKLTAIKTAGCVIGFVGVVLVNFTSGTAGGGFSFFGEGFIILSALSYAVSSVLIKHFSKFENPVTLSGYQFFLGGIVMLVSGLLMGGSLSQASLAGIAAIIYLALLSALAYTIWSVLLKYNDVSAVTVYSFMIPVFGCILSALLLRESLKGSAIIMLSSLILVSAGIYLVNKKPKNGEYYES